ncbi:MAG TPA: hypothetical protein VGJ13_16000 [Pseudonocardiaceae bacterium]
MDRNLLVLAVILIVVRLCRELVSISHQIVRRASVERIVHGRSSGIRVTDRSADGDVLEIEVLPCGELERAPIPLCASTSVTSTVRRSNGR